MFLINIVNNDEELLEPYEWQDDDVYKKYDTLPLYHVDQKTLHDFMYGLLQVLNCQEHIFVVSDGHYCIVIEMKDQCIHKRGTISLKQSSFFCQIARSLPMTTFDYRILEEAYEKEFGLTRLERMKKISIEEVIDELFVVQYDQFLQLCQQLQIQKDDPHQMYHALKRKIEKGYSSLHELLYQELIQKR